jgi:hypothetical protein
MGCALATAACAPRATPPPAAPPAAAPVFPSGWAGRWEGALELWSAGAAAPSVRVPMVREMAARPDSTGAYAWRTTYAASGAAPATVKDYVIRAVDSAAGAWAVDERNGIVLPARLVGGALLSVYEVAGRQFLTREAVRGDTLEFELVYWPSTPADSSRGTGPGADAERGTVVRGFGARGVQRARLVRR